MTHPRILRAVAAVAVGPLLLSGCGEVRELLETRELAKVRDAQVVELAALHHELEMLGKELAGLPPDLSPEVARLRLELSAREAEEVLLEAEISGVYQRRRAIKSKFEQYRRNHVIR